MSENEMSSNTSTVDEGSMERAAPAPTSMQRQKLEDLAQELAQATEQRRNLLAKIETMRQAQQAAQGEADAARGQWAVKLRENDGTLTREVQKLRATEKSALSLVEEYRDIATELESELPRMDLALATLASDAIKSRDAIVQEAAEDAYGKLLDQVGDGMAVALKLFSAAQNAALDHRMTKGKGELAREFFGRLNVDVCQRLSEPSVQRQVKQRLGLPPLDLSDVDRSLSGSPASRAKLQQSLSIHKAT